VDGWRREGKGVAVMWAVGIERQRVDGSGGGVALQFTWREWQRTGG
jgi:hypothetical protein